MTIEERLRDTAGRPTGFDYMRLILAVGVVLGHSILISYGGEAQDAIQAGYWRPATAIVLPMFFCLSGFLVAGSLERSRSVVGFLGLRFIRIYPALIVEILLSSFLLGPLLTTVPLADYFGDRRFWLYLVNVTGHIHYVLPGLFTDNPYPDRVNGQLWTVPFELICYGAFAGAAALGLVRDRRRLLLTTVFLFLVTTGGFLWRHGLAADRAPTNVPGYSLIVYSFVGSLFYFYRERLSWRRSHAVVAAIASVVLLEVPPVGDMLAPVPITYLTVWLGLCNPRKAWLLRGADYSYGIYLYGYAVQQSVMTLGSWTHHWYWNVALSLPAVSLIAAASWYGVERPALALRGYVKAIEARWIGRRDRLVHHLHRWGVLRRPARMETVKRS